MSHDDAQSLQARRLTVPCAIVGDLVDALCALIVDSFPRNGRMDVGELTASQRKVLLRLGALMDYGIVPNGVTDQMRVLVKQIQEQECQKREYDTFSTRCPYCGHDGVISVIEVTLPSIGKTLDVNVPLQAHGFDVYAYCPPDIKDLSTEDGRARCDECLTEFDLGELFL